MYAYNKLVNTMQTHPFLHLYQTIALGIWDTLKQSVHAYNKLINTMQTHSFLHLYQAIALDVWDTFKQSMNAYNKLMYIIYIM